MSTKTDKLLEKFQQQKKLIEAFSVLKVSFGGKSIPSNVKEQVSKEIKVYAEKRINDIDNGTVDEVKNSSDSFNAREVKALKHFVNQIAKRTTFTNKKSNGEDVDPDSKGFIGRAIDTQRKSKRFVLLGDKKVQLMATSQGKAVIKYPDGTKHKVEFDTLHEIK